MRKQRWNLIMWSNDNITETFKILNLIEKGFKNKENLTQFLKEKDLNISELILSEIISTLLIILIISFSFSFLNGNFMFFFCIASFITVLNEIVFFNKEWVLYFKLNKVLKG